MTIDKTTGLIAAPPTGFNENGEVNLDCIAPLAHHLYTQGVSGVFINGTTGEGMSLSVDERKQTAEAWRRALPNSMKLFVHVGHNSIVDARCMAAHAQSIGADAIAAIAPGFFKPGSVEDLVEWCAQTANTAPELPFYFYHMPCMNDVHISVAEFLQAGAPRIPTLAGVKYTFEALDDYLAAVMLDNNRFDVMWGRDEMLLAGLAMGAVGAVGATYNVAAPLYIELMDAFQRNDLDTARQIQARSITMIKEIVATGHFFVALKAILRAQGVPIPTRVRTPLANPPPDTFAIPSIP